ncbi:MAG: carboxypeptidase-like regulatory domain-containing protein [Elainellaceae cyanobacterium]
MRRYAALWVGITITTVLFGSPAAVGHGVDLTVEATQALQVTATYDSGAPMADAAVTIYAPNQPTEPWATGTTDAEGRFSFTPDLAIAGDWDLQVRQAGHGEILSIPVAEGGAGSEPDGSAMLAQSSNLLSPLQKGLMIGSVSWGCLGTALFFSTRTRHST